MKSTDITGMPVHLIRILATRWRGRVVQLHDPYRPERHYMRGPGPKSLAKLGQIQDMF